MMENATAQYRSQQNIYQSATSGPPQQFYPQTTYAPAPYYDPSQPSLHSTIAHPTSSNYNPPTPAQSGPDQYYPSNYDRYQ